MTLAAGPSGNVATVSRPVTARHRDLDRHHDPLLYDNPVRYGDSRRHDDSVRHRDPVCITAAPPAPARSERLNCRSQGALIACRFFLVLESLHGI